jgi:hypothetical protein
MDLYNLHVHNAKRFLPDISGKWSLCFSATNTVLMGARNWSNSIYIMGGHITGWARCSLLWHGKLSKSCLYHKYDCDIAAWKNLLRYAVDQSFRHMAFQYLGIPNHVHSLFNNSG